MDIRIKKSIEVLNYIIKDLGLPNAKKLSETLGFSRPERIYKILRGKSSISRNLASIINEKFPKYSIEWLLTGVDQDQEDEVTFYFEKQGVKISVEELVSYVVKNEQEFMKSKIFSNFIEVKVAKKVAEITTSKEKLLEYLRN